MFELRAIGDSAVRVSPVAMGCWPIAGITTLGANDADSLATLVAAFDHGINHFDTAHCYGYDGESERLIAKALGSRRKEIAIASKVGIAYNAEKVRITDGHPLTLKRQCDISLSRLKTDQVELLYLHTPDPALPLADSAGALRELQLAGKAVAIGLCNATVSQTQAFHLVCPLAAVQLRYNMLQREIESDIIPWCERNKIAVLAYWPLMKGILAGRFDRDHAFDPADPRLKYPIFHGRLWQANQNFLDTLRQIAAEFGKTVAQIVVNWTMHRPGITSVLCGAKRPWQIIETADVHGWRLHPSADATIDAAYSNWRAATNPDPVSPWMGKCQAARDRKAEP